MKLRLATLLGLCAVTLGGKLANAAIADQPRAELFEKKIRPILMDNCFKCHSPAAPKLKGGLNLSNRDGLLKGGENGPAIVPGSAEKSKLIEAINWTNKDLQMPPKTKLSDANIADLTRWVQMGAPWGGGNLTANPGGVWADYNKLRATHWAWQPLHEVKPPTVKNSSWPDSDVDKFVLAKMESGGLHPVGPADKFELLRRVTYDLTGLPPTPSEIDAFVADLAPDAYEKVVDRLLESPQFGERWGRHWLDIARYAESTGSARNFPYQYAWEYRNYVIDSFNADKPYNQFVTEQLAGDLLPYKNVKQHDEQLIATGFLAMGVKDLNEKDRLKYTMDNVDEQIDVVSKSMLGMTVSCARCHDHKFDPIPQSDYYKLAGIFRSTEILAGVTARRGGGQNYEDDKLLVKLEPVNGTSAGVAANHDQIAQLQQRLQQTRNILRSMGEEETPNRAQLRKALASNDVAARQQLVRANTLRQQMQNIQTQIATLQEGSSLAIGVTDISPTNSPIFEHGDVDTPGPVVQRGMISLCKFVSTPSISQNQSGRLELARWIASRDNPLTTRVVVNRIWHHLFGAGIVRTVDNFGTTGEAPINPELLDYLANRFVQDGWSFKKMIRELVLTRTYQLAGTWDAIDRATDPGDRLLWRAVPRRLEAEEIRDAILAVGGDLDTNRPAGSEVAALGAGPQRQLNANALTRLDSRTCRTVYLPVVRDLLPMELDRFDFANPEMVTGDREVTTVAPQALYLMNDSFVIKHAEQMASRLLEHDWMDQAARVDLAYKLAFGRPATALEKQTAAHYLAGFNDQDSRKAQADGWSSFCQALLASAEFRYLN